MPDWLRRFGRLLAGVDDELPPKPDPCYVGRRMVNPLVVTYTDGMIEEFEVIPELRVDLDRRLHVKIAGKWVDKGRLRYMSMLPM